MCPQAEEAGRETPNAPGREHGQGLRQVTPATSPFLRNGEMREHATAAERTGGAPPGRPHRTRLHVAGTDAAPGVCPSRGLAKAPKPNHVFKGSNETRQRRNLERPWNRTAGPPGPAHTAGTTGSRKEGQLASARVQQGPRGRPWHSPDVPGQREGGPQSSHITRGPGWWAHSAKQNCPQALLLSPFLPRNLTVPRPSCLAPHPGPILSPSPVPTT